MYQKSSNPLTVLQVGFSNSPRLSCASGSGHGTSGGFQNPSRSNRGSYERAKDRISSNGGLLAFNINSGSGVVPSDLHGMSAAQKSAILARAFLRSQDVVAPPDDINTATVLSALAKVGAVAGPNEDAATQALRQLKMRRAKTEGPERLPGGGSSEATAAAAVPWSLRAQPYAQCVTPSAPSTAMALAFTSQDRFELLDPRSSEGMPASETDASAEAEAEAGACEEISLPNIHVRCDGMSFLLCTDTKMV